MEKLTFKNGDKMPIIGLGTWKSDPGDVYNAVLEAIKVGYRHIDCAPIYGNEKEVGDALQKAFSDGLVKREELWITSKLWNSNHRKEQVKPGIQKTLSDLQLDYLDLYLMHWPVALKEGTGFPDGPDKFLSLDEVPISETWSGLEAIAQAGLARHIGVSNFTTKKIGELLKTASHKPEMNQVELHPFLQQRHLLEYCASQGMLVTAYSPLGSADRPARARKENEPKLMEHETIVSIAKKHDCTPAQVLISWAVHRSTAVIPKSVNPGRIKQNFDAAQVTLDSDDMQQIASIDKGYRFVDGGLWAMEGSPYSMASLWDE
jgi:alcohol dehydrogenase (NADP+)